MNEEISFTITDSGSTDKLIKLLQALGLSGEEARKRLETVLPPYINAARAAEDQQKLMNVAMNAGIKNTELLRDAVNQLSEVELLAARNSQQVTTALQKIGVEEQAVALKAKQAAEALDAQAKSANGATTATQGVTGAQGAGVGVSGSYTKAQDGVDAAHKKTTDSAKSATQALKDVGTTVGSIIGTLGIYASAHKVLHNVDAYESVKMSLKAVLGASKDVSKEFEQLAQIAIKTQQPLEVVGKNYAQIYASLAKTADGGKSAMGVMNGLSLALYATQTPAAAAARVMHDFAESMSAGNLGGMQLKSALMQAPQVMYLFSDALGKNVSSLSAHSKHVDHLKEKLGDLKNAEDGATKTVAASTSAYESSKASVESLGESITKHNAKLDAMREKRGTSAAAIAKEEAAIGKLVKSYTQEQAELQKNAREVGKAAEAQQLATAKKEAAIKKELSNIEALSRENIIAVLTSKKFTKSITELADIANGTVKGAFEVLNTQFMLWLHTTGAGDAIVKVFNVTLAAVGNNLSVVIPLMASFMALMVVGTIAAMVMQIRALSAVLATFNAVMVVTRALTSPYMLIITAIAAAVALALTYFDKWSVVQSALNSLWQVGASIMGTLRDIAVGAWNFIAAAMQPVTEHFMPMFNDLAYVSLKVWGELKKAWNDAGQAIHDAIYDANGEMTNFGKVVEKVWNDVIVPFVTYAVQGFGVMIYGAVTVVVGAIKLIEMAIGGVIKAVQAAIEWFGKLAGAKAAAGVGAGGDLGDTGTAAALASAPAARNGASWTVGGSSGVDSRLIAVSPGERVTVSTPAQHYGHTAMPASGPVVAAFRDGGSLYPADRQTQPTASDSSAANIVGQAVSNNVARTSHDAPKTVVTHKESTFTTTTTTTTRETSTTSIMRNRESFKTSDGGGGGGSTSSGGTSATSTPTRDSSRNWAYEQATNPHHLTATPNSGLKDDGTRYSRDELQKMMFRDGGSFTVPGSSGVDSRLMSIIASPGEEVTVKTPAQQYAEKSAKQSGGNKNVNITIVTNDATSFQRSKSQVASDLKRQLGKAV